MFFSEKAGLPLASKARSSTEWEEQRLLSHSRSSSSSSFESLRSPTSTLEAYPFPSGQDLEKAGPIHLGSTFSKSPSLRRSTLRIKPIIVSILALYVFCASLVIVVLLPRHHESRSMLYSRARSTSPLYRDLSITLGVVPKRIASHNDCTLRNVLHLDLDNNTFTADEQAVPLYTALAIGASSVEADVWWIDGEVRVGHHKHLTSPERTLKKLYVDPLLEILQKANPIPSDSVKGIFQTAPEIPLQFLIDFKEGSTELYNAVIFELEPLRAAGFLTTYNGTSIRPSAITAVASGEARLDLISAETNRDLFYDARLDLLSLPECAHLDPTISPMASVNLAHSGYSSLFFWRSAPYEKMQEWIDVAHSRGIATRFWGHQNAWSRRRVWRQLVRMGVDWLNSDELEEAAVF